ncbi:hypothetical protein MMC30_005437 [Trapelia coarctata]|nr:hypothetical protein [Trapelia coarctata]
MSWEQPVYSFNRGQPPTPTQTPTSTTFEEKEFPTPKAESSFYDPRVTWNTADPNAASPNLLKTPRPFVLTPSLKQTSTASSANPPLSGQDLEAEIDSHVHHTSSAPTVTVPSIEPKLQLSSPPTFCSADKGRPDSNRASTPPAVGLALDTGLIMQSAGSMQTPPPTSTSASRRKGKQAQVAKSVQHSDIPRRRMSTPLFPMAASVDPSAMQAEASPQQFQGLEFSPNVFEFPMSGPSTVPADSQHKLFWDAKDNGGMDVDFSGGFPDLFGTPHQSALDPFISAHHQLSTSQTPTSSSFLDFNQNTTKTSSMVNVSSSFEQNTFISTAGSVRDKVSGTRANMNGVDPTLLFSSPGRLAEPVQVSITSTVVLDDESLQPYAYQMQEAKREKAFGGIEKPKKRRKPESDSPAVKAALEALRGNDDEDLEIRCSTANSMILRTNQTTRHTGRASPYDPRRPVSAHRRSSPVKYSRSKITRTIRRPPHRRTSLALTIDSTGRARTEVQTIADGSVTDPEEDMRRVRYRSGSSESHEADDILVTSQAPSFDFPVEDPKRPKMGRFAHNSISHSSKSSYASTHASTSFAETWNPAAHHRVSSSQFPVGLTPRDGQSAPPGIRMSSESSQSSNHSYIDDSISEADTIMESDDGDGSAQQELRKVLKDREEARKSKSKSRSKPKHHLHSPLSSSTVSRYGKVGGGSGHRSSANTLSGSSPTKMSDSGLALFGSGGNKAVPLSIRCVCHMTTNSGQMITWYGTEPKM